MSEFTLWKPGELQRANLERPPYLIDPLLEVGGILLLHGPPTAGKTQLAMTLAGSIATGVPFLGRYPVQQGLVLFVQADMATELLKERLDRVEWLRNAPIAFLTCENTFDVLQPPPELRSAFLEAYKLSPTFVIVDSLRDVHDLDEDKSLSSKIVYQAWRSFFPGSGFCFIHHNSKPPKQGLIDDAARDTQARGSIAWLANAKAGFELKRRHSKSNPEEHLANLHFTKQRGQAQPDILLRMQEETLLCEPIEETAWHKLLRYKELHPAATKIELAQFLQGSVGATVGKSRAYALVHRLESLENRGWKGGGLGGGKGVD